MDKNKPIEEKTDSEKQRKKQKAGLNAVRPDDNTKNTFKDMAKSKGLSQTELFYQIFLNYIKSSEREKRNNILNLEGEINLISKELSNILEQFKTISKKAQDTILSISTNAEQTEKNLKLEIDTLKKKASELEKRNLELEKSNSIFTEIKESLEHKINELENLCKKLKTEVLENGKIIKELEKELAKVEKENVNLKNNIKKYEEEVNLKESRIRSLEISNESLTKTMSSIEELKKSEISSIEAKYKLIIEELVRKNENTENSLKKEAEVEKKLAIAEIKLELADTKSKYAAVINELNSIKEKKK